MQGNDDADDAGAPGSAPDSFTRAFVQALPGPLRAAASVDLRLTEKLAALVASARQAWPAIQVPPAVFCTALAERIDPSSSIAAALDQLHGDDLYLSCACAAGDAAALRAFERAQLGTIDAALAAAKMDATVAEEVKQRLRDRLFVGKDGGGKISTYRAGGSLRSWVRAAAIREAISMTRRRTREVPLGEALVDAVMPSSATPEQEYVKALYRTEFKLAFEAAMTTLDDRQRTLLRYKFLDNASIDDIAAVYTVHRATAARWLGRIREQLHTATFEHLAQKLNLEIDAVDSVVALIRSQLDASISAYVRR